MSEAEERTLHPEVQKLADDLKFFDGKIAMAKEQAVAWRDRARAWPAGDRQAFAVDLVILARRLNDRAPGAAREAVFLLAVLVAELAGSEEQARDMLEQGGVDVKKSAALLGKQAQDLSQVGAEPPAGARSMLGLLGDKKKD